MLIGAGRCADAIVPLHKLLASDERAAAKETDSGAVRGRVVIALVALARCGEAPRERLARALALMRQLKSEGRLRGNESTWMKAIEDELAKAE
jgi:hypothetical protein